jgi:hypothetical protein
VFFCYYYRHGHRHHYDYEGDEKTKPAAMKLLFLLECKRRALKRLILSQTMVRVENQQTPC